MKIRNLVLVLIFSISSFGISQASELGFDEVCKIYTEALNSNMSTTDSNQYIFDNVKTRVSDKDAATAHSVIYQAEPAQRYGLFKEAAEHYLNKDWSCSAMKTLMK